MPERTPSRADARLGLLDQARILAALAVVWIHTMETPALQRTSVVGRFTVPFFACAAGYFAATSATDRLTADFWRRARRLYTAFLAWSIVYLGVRLLGAAALRRLDQVTWPPLGELVTSGPVHHLWFLPFAVLLSALSTLTRMWPTRPASLAATLLVLSIGVTLLPRPSPELPAGYLVALTRDHLPAGLSGVVLGLRFPDRSRLGPVLRPLVVPALAVLAACGTSELHFGRQILIEDLYGVALFVGAAGLPARAGPRVLGLAQATLGVYLVHILFVEGLQDVLHGMLQVPVSVALDLGVFTVSTALSFALVRVLLRSPRTRWLVA